MAVIIIDAPLGVLSIIRRQRGAMHSRFEDLPIEDFLVLLVEAVAETIELFMDPIKVDARHNLKVAFNVIMPG